MPKLIDSEKLLEWCKKRWEMEMPDARYADGRKTILELVVGEIQLGTFDPTPVQPDTPKPGDMVKHISGGFRGEGIVKRLSKSGERAFVTPHCAYYRLDKLEVITDEN